MARVCSDLLEIFIDKQRKAAGLRAEIKATRLVWYGE